ncbi:hypothetical protein COW46_04690 [Candidatus Gracilibacteria bacterium CG17_big_fil_post_rev_8_21_14_2_50_48_13]|nr:MAG: hypothetical protein COW46_04690 [Candidatus Gracilibacteria bacterium CG17_big_fil_post_rev_8_21_14_2_50_48_13]
MRNGFTLVELVIVIGLMALLAAAISPAFTGNEHQASLSRTADILRQSFFETVMRAKTGAIAGETEQSTTWGFLIDPSTQEVRTLSLKTLNFSDASKTTKSAVLADATLGNNLLLGSINQTAADANARIENLRLTKEGSTSLPALLLLFEPVSNHVEILTDSGAMRPIPEEIYLQLHHTSGAPLGRTLLIQPSLATISPAE